MAETPIAMILVVILCWISTRNVLSQDVAWTVSTSVPRFNEDIQLNCTVSDKCCTSYHRTWESADGTLLLDNGSSVNPDKYTEVWEGDTTGFGLIIKNLQLSDVDVDYTCTYRVGIDKHTLTQDKSWEYLPTEKCPLKRENGRLTGTLNISRLAPFPFIYASHGNKDLTSDIKVTSLTNFDTWFYSLSAFIDTQISCDLGDRFTLRVITGTTTTTVCDIDICESLPSLGFICGYWFIGYCLVILIFFLANALVNFPKKVKECTFSSLWRLKIYIGIFALSSVLLNVTITTAPEYQGCHNEVLFVLSGFATCCMALLLAYICYKMCPPGPIADGYTEIYRDRYSSTIYSSSRNAASLRRNSSTSIAGSAFVDSHQGKFFKFTPWQTANNFDISSFPHCGVKPIIKVELDSDTNARNHHTAKYRIHETDNALVVRRGQCFEIKVEMYWRFNEKTDTLNLQFFVGPDTQKGTFIYLTVPNNDRNGNKWAAWILKIDNNKVNIRIRTPSSCLVGIWSLHMYAEMNYGNEKINIHKDPHKIYILFNPWCKDDTVYLDDDELLEEYILNESGTIYLGYKGSIHEKQWMFGQFQSDILDCAMYLLNTHCSSWSDRGDPMKICREISALVNGVLEGRWENDYKDGTPPISWISSVEILQQYYKKKTVVRYGQCWVFSGITTTLCRTLGIPARSVTNYSSAHCRLGSIFIDDYFTTDGNKIKSTGTVWNFHVWNDVWMGKNVSGADDYIGWQAIDATPQEITEGRYVCGPASLAAVKNGDVKQLYDTCFVYAEVSAKKIIWRQNESNDFEVHQIGASPIGEQIITKQPKRKTPGYTQTETFEDITSQYKYDDIDRANKIFQKAVNLTECRRFHEIDTNNDVKFTFIEKKVTYGDDFQIILRMTNNSGEKRSVIGYISAASMYYHGVVAKDVKDRNINETIEANASKECILDVTFDEYYPKLVDHYHMMRSCFCKVTETKEIYVTQETLHLEKTKLEVKMVSPSVILSMSSKVEITVKNHLKKQLTGCTLKAESPNLFIHSIDKINPIAAETTFKTIIWFFPRKIGNTDLIVSFNSNELKMVEGSCEVDVLPYS